MENEFLMFVAEILEADVSEISMETEYRAFEKWDSLKMLRLVMELEAKYDVSIPIEFLDKIRRLKDLYGMVAGE